MADLTFKGAQAQNELVPGTPGASQEQITGAEVVGATSATNIDSGWTFTNLKEWVKLDADWMSKSVYDSGGTGRVDDAEQLNDGSNVVTAAQARTHIDDTSIHFIINDASTSLSVAWSGSKINTELGLKADQSALTSHTSDTSIHFVINDAGTSATEVWSASKTNTEVQSREPDLGNPAQDGYVLSSTVAGVRSWVAQSGGTDLSNAVFPDWAGFQVQGSTAATIGGSTNVNWSTSNKHALTGTGSTTLNTFTFPQANAHYFLLIPSTITIAGVTAANKQEYGVNDFTAGRAHLMAIYWDGTIAHWQSSEAPS